MFIMEKRILLLVILLVNLTVLFSQNVGVDKEKKQWLESTIASQQTISPVKKNEVIKQSDTRSALIIQALTKRERLSGSKVSRNLPEELKAANAHSLTGLYEAVGYDYKDGTEITWEVIVTQDTKDPNKFWFKNMIEKATINDVYGVLDGVYLSIPVGQVVVPKEATEEKTHDAWFAAITAKNELRWGGSPVVGRVSIGQGTVTFKEGFASVIVKTNAGKPSFTLFGAIAIDPAAVFVNTNGGTGEDDPVPQSVYVGPEGIMFLSMSKDWRSLNANFAYAPPYSTWTFVNQTEKINKLTNKWTYNAVPNLSSPGEILEAGQASTKRDLVYAVSNEMRFMPTLESFMPTESTEFTLGATNAMNNTGKSNATGYTIAYIEAGGGFVDNGTRVYNLTNLNPDYDIHTWTFTDKDYVFGTGPTCNCSSLVSYFEGNKKGYTYFEGVDVFFGKLTGPASTELKLSVVHAQPAENGKIELGEVYATAKLKISDKYEHGEGYGTLSFNNFYKGSSKLSYMEIPGSFALVLSGFDASGVEFGMVSELVDRPDDRNYSYFISKSDESVDYYLEARNTMYFSLVKGMYSYIYADKDYINAADNGGGYTLELIPYFESLELISVKPDWITLTQIDDNSGDYLKSKVQIKVDPLPNGVSGRVSYLEYATRGARKQISVAQGDKVGIDDIVTPQVVVSRGAECFNLSYPQEVNSVTVYTLTGQRVAVYALSPTGTDSISHIALPNGVYIFIFKGVDEIVKVVK